MEVDAVRLRPFEPGDLEALYAISLLTGDAGGDAAHLHDDPRLIGEIYSAPYAMVEPSWAFVAEDDLGVAGYVVGAPDTRAFEAVSSRSGGRHFVFVMSTRRARPSHGTPTSSAAGSFIIRSPRPRMWCPPFPPTCT